LLAGFLRCGRHRAAKTVLHCELKTLRRLVRIFK
jgi:hypothetical protein